MDDPQRALSNLQEMLLKGKVTADEVFADRSVEESYLSLKEHIGHIHDHLRQLSNGRLSGDIAVQGYTYGLLKNLQSNLLHVTWQAKQIASGDLTQRVDFLDEFSDSFNSMVASLQANRRELELRQEDLMELNERLKDEVAERQRAEQGLANANHKLMILSSITRHDTLNQITASRGYMELMANKLDDDAVAKRYNSKATTALDNMVDLITFAKEYEMVGLQGPQWAEISSIISKLDPKHFAIEEYCQGLEVHADPMVDKVFYNLLDNAERHASGATRISVSYELGDDGLSILWEDDGPGVALEDKERIFERGVGKNTGFGLFLTREILMMTGLSIVEDGEPGKGARFIINVPKGSYRLDEDHGRNLKHITL